MLGKKSEYLSQFKLVNKPDGKGIEANIEKIIILLRSQGLFFQKIPT